MNLFMEGWKAMWEKERNANYQDCFPFPKMISEGYLLRIVKSWDCLVKG